MKYRIAQSSRLGNRNMNQDRCASFVRDRYILLVLADGMGGHKGGEKAAQEVIDTFETVFHNIALPIANARSFLQQIFTLSHNSIREKYADEVNIPRTTGVACLIAANQAMWAHVGDSRLYLFRDNIAFRRTRDHSYIEDMLQHEAITDEEAANHPMRNYVTACLGGSAKIPHISISDPIALKTSDKILLCSDGLWSGLSEQDVIDTLGIKSLDQAIDSLTDKADQASYPKSDNTTGIVINIEDSTPPSGVELETLPRQVNDNKNDLQQAIDDIEMAYYVYQNEISKK